MSHLRKKAEPEPKSWADLVKQREAERNQPPPKDAYVLQPIRLYEDGGIFPDTTSEIDQKTREILSESNSDLVDTHFYSSTAIFDEEEAKPRAYKPNHDHGNEPFIWPKKSKYTHEEPKQPLRVTKRDIKTRDFDLVTGVPFENSFKSTVKHLLDQKEKSQSFKMNRNIDPISNTFPTQELEQTRVSKEALETQANISYHLSKMPETIQRSQNGTLNVITGECTDKESLKAINEFPNSSMERGKKRWERESEIVEGREMQRSRETERVGCRYNNGRERMLRDFNIVNGSSESHSMDISVKSKPSVWQWCQAERLET